MTDNRIQLCKAQSEEFKALEDFKQIASPAQWNIHYVLKSKVKLCSIKKKNYCTATKQVEYDLLPKFIEKVDPTWKIDESIVDRQDAQGTYDYVRQMPDSCSTITRGLLGPAIINDAQTPLTEEEHQLLNLGPRFIYNDPQTAARRRTTELATLKRKIKNRFFDKKVSPCRPVEQFIVELDEMLQDLHNIPTTTINNNRPSINKKKKNYGRLIKRLKFKFKSTNTILRKTDKSTVFHLGKVDDYTKKSDEYMEKTKAYKCLGTIDPLPDLIRRTNKYLLDLRLAKWISQKQYEQLCIQNSNDVELAHLYYLPKAHKPGTPLRPIVAGLKHPTIKISKLLGELLRPLFDQMASKTTITSGFELLKHVQEWTKSNLRQNTLFCTIDVTDLYTMVPQVEGV
ncbi:unnamed protein product [Rotaria magnacalcarata]|uniref:Reverse transcriptase domain-containing protein n=1 Tax=Rotaria magnacalcarata TaxID=392030 RepID=A0A820JCE6_9BILA|nr:unnamed protein product [Rotaria magnacalcarata]CAF4324637.1 unnamed protein product [Rotaria magnacalcarata]